LSSPLHINCCRKLYTTIQSVHVYIYLEYRDSIVVMCAYIMIVVNCLQLLVYSQTKIHRLYTCMDKVTPNAIICLRNMFSI
jgi:hypothetical protein